MFKKILVILMTLVPIISSAALLPHYHGVVQNVRGDAVSGAAVTVYDAGTTDKATLYEYGYFAGGIKANPMYTSTLGMYDFFTTNGVYDIEISRPGVITYTISDVTLLTRDPVSFSVLDYGAIPDDGLDDSAAIIATIAAAQVAGAGVVTFPPGTFRTDTELVVDSDGISIVGSGMNSTIIVAGSTGHHGFVVSGADYVNIRDLAVKDFTDVGAGEVHGIRIEDGDHATVERCFADNCDDAGIRFSYVLGGDSSRHGRIIGNVVLNTPEGSGIEVLGADSLIVQGNTVKNCSGSAIRVTGSANSIISENNIFCASTSSVGIVVAQADLAGDLKDSYNVSLIDNHISGTFGTGINLNVHVHDVKVRGNIIKHDGVTGYGIRAYDAGLERTWDWYDLDITGNKITGTSNGIFLSDDGERARIFDNKIDGAETAIYVLAAAGDTINNVEIRRNQIINTSGSKRGIRIDGTPGVSIYDNDFEMAASTVLVTAADGGGMWGPFDVARFGATGNDTIDDTAAIQAAINARVAVGGVDINFLTADYIVDSEITIGTSDIVINGNGSTITSSADNLFTSTATNLLIRDITITGTDVLNQTASWENIRFERVVFNGTADTVGDNLFETPATSSLTGNRLDVVDCELNQCEPVFADDCAIGNIYFIGNVVHQPTRFVLRNLDQLVAGVWSGNVYAERNVITDFNGDLTDKSNVARFLQLEISGVVHAISNVMDTSESTTASNFVYLKKGSLIATNNRIKDISAPDNISVFDDKASVSTDDYFWIVANNHFDQRGVAFADSPESMVRINESRHVSIHDNTFTGLNCFATRFYHSVDTGNYPEDVSFCDNQIIDTNWPVVVQVFQNIQNTVIKGNVVHTITNTESVSVSARTICRLADVYITFDNGDDLDGVVISDNVIQDAPDGSYMVTEYRNVAATTSTITNVTISNNEMQSGGGSNGAIVRFTGALALAPDPPKIIYNIGPATMVETYGDEPAGTIKIGNIFGGVQAGGVTSYYGSMYQHSGAETITLTAANVDSVITGWTVGEVNDVTFGAASRALQINTAGTYLITWAADVIGIGTGTNVYEVCVGINGTRTEQSCGHASTDNNTEDRTMGGSMIYVASVDDLIQLTVRNTIDDDDVDVDHASLTVVRIN